MFPTMCSCRSSCPSINHDAIDLHGQTGFDPESNGMAEAFVETFKRDYIYGWIVLMQKRLWHSLTMDRDEHGCHPHKGLKMKLSINSSAASY